MKELIEKLEEFQVLIANKEVTIETLDAFVETSKELYEKAVILRYKAYENQVFGTSLTIEHQVETTEEQTPNVEIPSIDFSLFTEEETLTNVEEKEEILATTFQNEPIENLDTNEEETVAEVEAIVSSIEEEIETTNTVEEVAQEDIQEDTSAIQNSNIELKDEAPEPTLVEQPFQNHFGLGKLDTLIGSFGLNERLQYINELFDGSSEAFSDGIKRLDQQANYAAAREILVEYAKAFEWDKESETVIEFAQKVARRYA